MNDFYFVLMRADDANFYLSYIACGEGAAMGCYADYVEGGYMVTSVVCKDDVASDMEEAISGLTDYLDVVSSGGSAVYIGPPVGAVYV